MDQPAVILVVDDDADTIATISTWLKGKGYQVVTAGTGAEALERARKHRPDVALLDVSLPDITGIEVAKALQADASTAGIALVFVTGRRESRTRAACFEAGAEDYVTKPFDFIEVETRLRAVLRKKDLRDELQRANRALRRANKALKKLLITDEKTKLHNYRFFKERIGEEFKRAARYDNPLSCIMIDLDHFKDINDTLGHHIGDRVLEEFGRVLTDQARETDLVIRYGGEEFIILLPHTVALRAATVAERIRRATSTRTFTADKAPLKLTVSCGVATYPDNPHIKNEEDLVRVADEALYVAKNGGRNRTETDPESLAKPRSIKSRGRGSRTAGDA
jgi:two-component system cell cycle response regulator